MAQLYYTYGTMNCGKTMQLLSVAHNYRELGMRPFLLTFLGDNRYEVGRIASRTGLSEEALTFDRSTSIIDLVKKELPDVVLIDEAQFLTKAQVFELSCIVDIIEIPVMCYGIRSDFKGELFEGSQELLTVADKLQELKTLCHCGKKATMILRIGEDGKVSTSGSQVQIGGNESYQSVCRKHFYEKKIILK